jgi:hypothetical protein
LPGPRLARHDIRHASRGAWLDLGDLFGCDYVRLFARINQKGLVWLLRGDRLMAITADAAITETKSGARLTFRRRRES